MSKLAEKVKRVLHGSGATSVLPTKEIAALVKNGALILDVRTMLETRRGSIPGATTIPLLRLKKHLSELPRDKTIVTYCGTGARAGKARDVLEAAGFKAVNGGGYAGMRAIVGDGAPRPAERRAPRRA